MDAAVGGGGTVQLTIADDAGTVEEKTFPVQFPFSRAEYLFTGGTHGKAYTVSVTTRREDGTCGETFSKRLLFLEYDRLPDLPLLTVETFNGEDPVYEVAEKPGDALWGETITNSQYAYGILDITRSTDIDLSEQVRIRVRGNTSAVKIPKKPYKIVLDEPRDLLGLGSAFASKEWILLNAAEPLKTFTGTFVSTLCGMEWQPQMRFVNLMLNGDWKGLYALIQPVNRQTAGEFISNDGVIFESDTYYWAPGRISFGTDAQLPQFGFTFKYPEITRADDKRLILLQRHVQEFENYVLSNDPAYKDYIDEATFADWILARDVLNQGDGGGSNRYYYKYDMDEGDLRASKIKMGPLWDFDLIFSGVEGWSDCRKWTQYIPNLFGQESFRQLYREKWEEVSPHLYDDVETLYDTLYEAQGPALDESLALNGQRWESSPAPIREQMRSALDWFAQRIDWINQQMKTEEWADVPG